MAMSCSSIRIDITLWQNLHAYIAELQPTEHTLEFGVDIYKPVADLNKNSEFAKKAR